MPSRNLTVDIESTVDDKGFKSAAQSASVFERELAKLEARQARVDRASTQIGKGLLATGAAIAAGLGLAAKAAIDWESAWAGVTKVVEGSPEQMAALEKELRGLAKTLPATHEEIAGVAEAAGQLGVKRQDIVEFTKTMVALGVSTNLSAQDAATGLARLMNIMGTSTDQVDNLGASLVALGNAGASTETDILEMSLRIAGAGRTIGLSEGEVLGFANALSSVGVEAEAGGTAISTTFVKIAKAVAEGGDQLDGFAQVAGMTAEQFKTAYQQDAAGAIVSFVEGLSRIQASGQNVFAVLDDLGLGGIRVRDTLLRAASSSDQFASSLKLGNQAFRENTALQDEAAKRYETTAAKLQVAKNNVTDFAISIGNQLLPFIAKLAEVGTTVVNVFDSLPGPVKEAAAMLALAAAAMTLLAGAALVAAPRIAATKLALETLGMSASGAAGKLGLLGTALTVLPAIVAAFTRIANEAADSSNSWGDRLKGVNRQILDTFDPTDKLSRALGLADEKQDAAAGSADAAAQAEKDMKVAIEKATPEIDDQAQALQDLNSALDELYGQLFDVEAAQDDFSRSVKDGVKRAKEAKLSNLDLRDSGRQLVQQAFKIIEAQAQQGASVGKLNTTTKTLKQRIYEAMIQMGASKTEARHYADALNDVPEAISTNILAPGLGGANNAVSNYLRQLRTIPGSVTTYVNTVFVGGRGGGRAILAGGGLVGDAIPGFPSGGQVNGSGGPRDDSNLIWASNREFVQPVNAVDYYGVPFMESIRRMQFPRDVAIGDTGFDQAGLSRAVAREVGRAIDGATLIIDDRGRGRLMARDADLYARGG